MEDIDPLVSDVDLEEPEEDLPRLALPRLELLLEELLREELPREEDFLGAADLLLAAFLGADLRAPELLPLFLAPPLRAPFLAAFLGAAFLAAFFLPPFLAADLRAPPVLLPDDFFAAFLADFFFALAISRMCFCFR